jgi:hemolysin III
MKKQEIQPEYFQEFTRRQEMANILIHILGIVFGLVAIPFLITMAKNHNTSHIISISIYAFCFLMLFACSTLYHAVRRTKLKMLFKKLDRISIYFLIAGTYTPIIRFYLFDGIGIALLVILWTLVLAGIFFEIFFPNKFNIFSVIAYLIMGLIFIFVPNHFFSSMPMGVILLVLTGVSLYCFGVIFYLWQKWTYHHAIWHFFVLGGSVCHFAALLQTVA